MNLAGPVPIPALPQTGGCDDGTDRNDRHGDGLDPPRALADALDRLVAATLETDREIAAILVPARESLRALAWNRYAAMQTRASRAHVPRRRHQGHTERGW